MNKRTILAVIISFLILVVWSRFFGPAPQDTEQGQNTDTEQSNIAKQETIPIHEQEQRRVQEIIVETETCKILLSTQGASIIEWKIKEKVKGVEQLVNLSLDNSPNISAFENIIFDVDKDSLVLNKENPQDSIKFTGLIEKGLLISKEYTFYKNDYLVDVDILLENNTDNQIKKNILLKWGPGIGINEKAIEENLSSIRAMYYIDGQFKKKAKPGEYKGDVSWTAIDNRYFVLALIPMKNDFSEVVVTKDDISLAIIKGKGILNPKEKIISRNTKLPSIGLSHSLSLSAKQQKSLKLRIYGGPKLYDSLKSLSVQMESVISLGMFGLGKVILSILTFFYKWGHNYGVAIILMTCVIQVFLFPLSSKSYKSMHSMQKIQPLVAQIKEKYKDDPKRVNVEVMNLYKTHKVSPFGGCLPLLLQIPIFWSLFTTLRTTIELRYVPFLWIPDMASYDPFFILPIIMGGSMFIQQKMTTVDSSQAKMMVFMPVLFTFLFMKFPAGLVLYWLVNNILTILGQMFILKPRLARQSS